MWRRAARAGHGPCAPRRLTGASQPVRARLCGSARGVRPKTTHATTSRQAAPGRGDFCGDEERSAGVGARSALRELTRRYCLNVAPSPQGLARSELSARPRREHRSAVGPKGRPPQHEPLPGAAWRDALTARKRGCSASPAMHRTGQRAQYLPSRVEKCVGLPRLGPPRDTQSATQSIMRSSGTRGSPNSAWACVVSSSHAVGAS